MHSHIAVHSYDDNDDDKDNVSYDKQTDDNDGRQAFKKKIRKKPTKKKEKEERLKKLKS